MPTPSVNSAANSYVNSLTSSSSSTSKLNASDPAAAQDRFMTLLVAQLNNQDPMNPMDNAQMTSQIAQINTVTGISQVNETLKSLSEQFTSLQMMQGAAMVGHDVLVPSDSLTRNEGVAKGAVNLTSNADSVRVEILTPGGQLIDTINMGSLTTGNHAFSWNASSYQGTGEPTMRVVATRAGKTVEASTLAQDRVMSVGSANGSMTVQLRGLGTVPYSSIQSIL